jgi:menaquinone-dependent protoporphyrinogen IX oxidase
MKTMVVYESQTGFTSQYAAWIAQALQGECLPLKQVTAQSLTGCDRVIFGGWVMGNGVVGLEKLRALTNPAAVFAVGSSPAYEEVVATIREQNKLGDVPLYYMEGGFRFEKLGFPQKLLLKALKKSVSKKQNRTRQEEFMAIALGTSFDHSAREQIAPLVRQFEVSK